MTSVKPAKMVYSPSNGFLRKKRSKTALVVCRLEWKYAYAIVIWYLSLKMKIKKRGVKGKRNQLENEIGGCVGRAVFRAEICRRFYDLVPRVKGGTTRMHCDLALV